MSDTLTLSKQQTLTLERLHTLEVKRTALKFLRILRDGEFQYGASLLMFIDDQNGNSFPITINLSILSTDLDVIIPAAIESTVAVFGDHLSTVSSLYDVTNDEDVRAIDLNDYFASMSDAGVVGHDLQKTPTSLH